MNEVIEGKNRGYPAVRQRNPKSIRVSSIYVCGVTIHSLIQSVDFCPPE